jgi:hypothetical protein
MTAEQSRIHLYNVAENLNHPRQLRVPHFYSAQFHLRSSRSCQCSVGVTDTGDESTRNQSENKAPL